MRPHAQLTSFCTGDAYLKYLSSVYLFVTFPTQSEGALHVSRQRIISNRSLLRNSVRCGLPQYIQSKALAIKVWAPPNFHIYHPPKPHREEPVVQEEENENTDRIDEQPVDEANAEEDHVKLEDSKRPTPTGSGSVKNESDGEPSVRPADIGTAAQTEGTKKKKKNTASKKMKQEQENEIQWLGDKVWLSRLATRKLSLRLQCVADVAEAIIGAAYATKGREIALKVTKALNIPVPHIDRWSDFGRKALAPSPEVTAKLKDGSIEAVEKIIGHKFNHPHLLAQALVCVTTNSSPHDADIPFRLMRHFMGMS